MFPFILALATGAPAPAAPLARPGCEWTGPSGYNYDFTCVALRGLSSRLVTPADALVLFVTLICPYLATSASRRSKEPDMVGRGKGKEPDMVGR